MKLKLFLLYWIGVMSVFLSAEVYSRNFHNLDSLQIKLNVETSPYIKTKLLYEIGRHYKCNNHLLKHQLANEIFHIADSLKYVKAEILGNMLKGEAYLYESKEYKSISFFSKALELAEEIQDDTLISECLYNFFYFHFENDQYNIARSILKRKMKIDSAFNSPKLFAQNHDFMGLLCEQEGLYDSAKYHYKEAFTYALESKDSASASTYLNNVAIIFGLQNQYQSAIDLHKYVCYIKSKIDDYFTIGYVKTQIAKNYYELNQLDSAHKYANEAIKPGTNLYITVKSNAYQILYKIYKRRNQPAKALYYLELYNVENDSLNSQAKANALANVQYNFEVERKNREIQLKQLELNNKDLLIYFGLAGLGLVTAFSIVLLIGIIENRKLNKILAKQKAELYEQNIEIESQNEEILAINQHQEEVIEQRTKDLKENEALLSMAQKLAKLGSWVLDAQRPDNMIKCSGEMAYIFEFLPNTPLTLDKILAYMARQDADNFYGYIKNTIANKVPFEVEIPIYTQKGQHKWIHFIAIPVLSPKNEEKVIEVMGCAQDITERKQAEQLVLEQTEELIETHKKAAEYKLMALRSVMNPHFLFNSLNSIQYFIAKNIREKALDYLSQFSKLMRLVLNSSIQNKVSLADEIETLRLYCSLEAVRFENFDTLFEVDEELDTNNIFIPSLLLQPYVENAILHGLSKRNDKLGLLKISFTYNDDNDLVCTIDDNGIGRAQSRKLKEGENKLHKSLGMLVTSERLELINQNDVVGVKIIDKTDAFSTPTGTMVEVTIKLETQSSSHETV